MYSYEKQLKYRIEDVLGRSLGELERDLFGADGVLSEALSNAFVHGHRRDQYQAIEVACQVGENGLLFSIRDQGQGFDLMRAMAELARGGTYFHMAGNGLRALAQKPGVIASYDNGGSVLHIRVHLDHTGNG
jgi:two-component sensor histidine kinase